MMPLARMPPVMLVPTWFSVCAEMILSAGMSRISARFAAPRRFWISSPFSPSASEVPVA